MPEMKSPDRIEPAAGMLSTAGRNPIIYIVWNRSPKRHCSGIQLDSAFCPVTKLVTQRTKGGRTGIDWILNDFNRYFCTIPDVTKVCNLLNSSTFIKLSQSPAPIRQEPQAGDRIIVIDEIQKLPWLLDEVRKPMSTSRFYLFDSGVARSRLRNLG